MLNGNKTALPSLEGVDRPHAAVEMAVAQIFADDLMAAKLLRRRDHERIVVLDAATWTDITPS